MQTTKKTPSPWLRLLAAMSVISVAAPGAAFAQGATAPADAAKPAAEAAAPAATPPPAPVTPEPAPATGDVLEEDILVLTPFTVDAKKDRGYFAENTLAGSRMRTKLSDLGSSISVVNKAMMEDFASSDFNDVFRYEASTEGSSTYTPQTATFRNDGILDVNAGGTLGNNVASLTNATANRVRGLGVPTPMINYYKSIGNIPPDSYNTQSFEISRGPNAIIYGLGSPAGMINQSTAQADLSRNTNRVELRTDDRGSFRSSLSFNRVLLQNKLAIYGALLYDDRQFERKPSYDISRRQYGAITYKPFSKTALSFNFENYNNSNRRPNTISPVDLVTQWNLAGRPIYDPVTKTINVNGRTVGPYIANASSPYAQQTRNYIINMPGYNPALRNTASDLTFTSYNGITIFGQNALNPALSSTVPNPNASALWVPGLSQFNQGRSIMQISDGQLTNWVQPLYGQSYRTGYNNPAVGADPTAVSTTASAANYVWGNATWADMYNRDYYQSGGWTNNSFITNLGNYKYPGVTDRSILDWKKINVNAANFGKTKNKTYIFDLQQGITDDLFISGGWFRQDYEQVSNYTIAQLNATALKIDVNQNLPDGRPNPYVGLPFVNDFDPDQYVNKEVNDRFRLMMAYTPDFTKNSGWTRWLGRHQFMGLWSRDEDLTTAIRKRLNYVGATGATATYRYLPNPNPGAGGAPTGWSYQGGGSLQRNFYLAAPGGPMGVATRSSGAWDADRYTGGIRMYNYGTSSFEDAVVTTMYNVFDSPVRNQRLLQSQVGAMTNYLWENRLITTFGMREEKLKLRATTTGAVTQPDGTVDPTLTNPQKFTSDGFFNSAVMWNRFGTAQFETLRNKTGGGVLRPFTGWSHVESGANRGNLFWEFVRNFGVSYNWASNNDIPPAAAVDGFGKKLPIPGGVGYDYGVQFDLLKNKLFVRVNWFKSNSNYERIAAGGAALGRLTSNMDSILFREWSRTIALINAGFGGGQSDPTNANFGVGLSQAQENQIQTAAAAIWKLPYTYYTDIGGMAATGDRVTKGVELQINYNTENWRNRFTFSKQDSVNTNYLREFDAWEAVRKPIWLDARATDYLLPAYQGLVTYTTSGGTPVDLTNFWTSYGYHSSARQSNTDGTTNVQNVYNLVVTPQAQLSRDLNGQSAPNQRKYRWSYTTGYDFPTRPLKGFGVGGAVRWEAKSVIGYYGKSSGSNTANRNLIDISDTSRPIYDKANTYVDVFIKYRRKIWREKINMTWQLNVVNVGEGGSLQTVAVNYDGTPYGYRIIDSRQFILSSTFEF